MFNVELIVKYLKYRYSRNKCDKPWKIILYFDKISVTKYRMQYRGGKIDVEER